MVVDAEPIYFFGVRYMGKAASLANKYREKDLFERYLSGSVLDIGAGADPVVAKAQISTYRRETPTKY